MTRDLEGARSSAPDTATAIVLAPFGVLTRGDADELSTALGKAAAHAAVVMPTGRPALAAEDAGLEVWSVTAPHEGRGTLELIRVALKIRRNIRRNGRAAVLWADGPTLLPYTSALKAGAWILGVRSLYRVRGAKLTAPEAIHPRVVTLVRIVRSNAAAYVAARRVPRRASRVDIPNYSEGTIRRIAYLRTDLSFTYSAEPGGSISHTEGVIGGLIDNHVDVVALSPRPLPVLNRPAPEWIPVTPRPRQDVHPELIRAIIDEEVERDLRAIEVKAVDAVYVRYSLFNAAATSLAGDLRVPLVLEFNGSEARFETGGKATTFERLGLRLEAALCRSASLVVVVSERVADEVRAMAPTARILVSPNAVDAAAFEVTDTVRMSERQRLAAADGDVLVGFVGRFYVWHGVDTLAEAATRFLNERPNSRLLLIGDGPYRESALRTLAPWGDRVIAPGIVSHERIPNLMAACDVLVAPHAPIEGFVGSPMKLFEYLASGRAIIASRLEQLADVITDGETGLLVTPGVVDELADAVIRLVDDPELRARLGRAGRQEALAKHTWQARVRMILDTVEGIDIDAAQIDAPESVESRSSLAALKPTRLEGDMMPVDPDLLDVLACPGDDHGTLRVESHNGSDVLVCTLCALIFPVRDGIPVLLLDEAMRTGPPALRPPRNSLGQSADD